MEKDDYKIIFYHSDEEEHQTDFSFLTERLFEESPIPCEHKLTFKKETEFGGREDFRFQMNFDGLDYYEFQDTLPKEQQEQMDDLFYIIGHKIGGYAYFTQSDPREYNNKAKNDILLLQIDSQEKIMFGDVGAPHLQIIFSKDISSHETRL